MKYKKGRVETKMNIKGSNPDGIFTVGKRTGIVSVVNPNDLRYDEYHLCALARQVL